MFLKTQIVQVVQKKHSKKSEIRHISEIRHYRVYYVTTISSDVIHLKSHLNSLSNVENAR